MESYTIITVNEHYDDGRVSVKTFKIKDDVTYGNILNELQFCKLQTEFIAYPNSK